MVVWKLKWTDIIVSGSGANASTRCALFVAPSPDHTFQRCGELSLTLAEARDLKARLEREEPNGDD